MKVYKVYLWLVGNKYLVATLKSEQAAKDYVERCEGAVTMEVEVL